MLENMQVYKINREHSKRWILKQWRWIWIQKKYILTHFIFQGEYQIYLLKIKLIIAL